MAHALLPCPRCHRHVLAAEPACPFCDEALNPTATAPARTPRLSRAMLVAAGAAMTLGGCDAPWISVAHADPVDDAITLAPQYGAPPEWLERRRRGDAGVSADVATTPNNPTR